MKRLLCLLLIAAAMLSLAGCGTSPADDSVTFFYARPMADYRYGEPDGVIASEYRDAAGHMDDLEYLLSLYLHGPVDESLISPFPAGTQLEQLSWKESILTIQLSSGLSSLQGSDLTLACTCIAKTCFELTEATVVIVTTHGSDSVSLRFTRDSLLLSDGSPQSTPQESE